jgi:drug/metabolite transporter (DMT)-like permease
VDALFDTVGGIPVHALVVHAVVVLVPLAAIGAVLMAVRPSFSRRFGSLVVIIAGIGAAASLVAKESGEQLALRVGEPDPHVELGDVMPLFASGLLVLVLVFWLFDRGIPANRSRPAWLVVLAVVMVIGAVAATWWTIRVGDSGAKAVWEPILQVSQPG